MNWLSRPAVISVTDNVGERFIDGARQGPAFASGKAQLLSQTHHRTAHDAQDFWIAGQLKSEQPAIATQLEASLPKGAK
jgi:hypothetical protein